MKMFFICHSHFHKYSELERDIHLPMVKIVKNLMKLVVCGTGLHEKGQMSSCVLSGSESMLLEEPFHFQELSIIS